MSPKAKPNFAAVFRRLTQAYPRHAFVEVNGEDPYRILVSCILSLRTQDTVSLPATQRLFNGVEGPQGILDLGESEIAKRIYPVGFYRNKAASIVTLSQRLLTENDGKVPGTMEGLLSFKGVGRKTANLVLSLGFNIPAICVDTHVHRITNRLGWLKTKTPEQTEFELMRLLPKRYWIPSNSLFVNHGQQTCRPIGPRCELCVVKSYCDFYKKRA